MNIRIFGALALGAAFTSCSAPTPEPTGEETLITILQTADIHGQVLPHSELFWEDEEISFKTLGGLANMKTIFDMEREANPNTIILDGGDLIQGSAVAALSKGAAFGPIVKAMNYDFLIPGNWEVVYGKEQMMKVLNSYETPVITANMFHDDETKTPIFPQYWIKEFNGNKLGFISYNDPEVPVRQNPSFSKGLDFDPILDNLEVLVTKLKEEEGVDILFVVTHIGISKQFDLANHPALAQVDYVLGNDTHERIRKPLQAANAKVTEPGAFASFVGKMVLTVKNGKIINEEYKLVEVDPKIYPANEEVALIIENQLAPYNDNVNEVLGYTKTPLYRYFVVENPMDNFITDAAYWKNDVDIALSNGFRFSPPINPGDAEVAPITRGDIWNMLPVNEKVKIGKASGEQIKNWLEKELHNVFAEKASERFGGWVVRFSGMILKFNANVPKGERVQDIMIGGEPIDLDKLYKISACRREGEPLHMLCRMPNTIETVIMDYTIHDLIEEYLAHVDTISPIRDGRAQALDLGDNVLSQLPGTDYHFH
tara:strand:- start:755 stop:2377 length:1623 start_codon:yes stop_codon:yes gene_type:complete